MSSSLKSDQTDKKQQKLADESHMELRTDDSCEGECDECEDCENGECNLKCEKPGCDKMFKSKYTLRRHMATHVDIKRFVCQFCDKRFALKQYLKEHLYIHTGESPYTCPFPDCGRSFKQAGKLSMHKKLHELDDTKAQLQKAQEEITSLRQNLQRAQTTISMMNRSTSATPSTTATTNTTPSLTLRSQPCPITTNNQSPSSNSLHVLNTYPQLQNGQPRLSQACTDNTILTLLSCNPCLSHHNQNQQMHALLLRQQLLAQQQQQQQQHDQQVLCLLGANRVHGGVAVSADGNLRACPSRGNNGGVVGGTIGGMMHQ
eukprot:CAMPEP_0115012040 /NCGR_PEP_ID=MMETSP0216-20121206/24453_1 /TAXON_ID=223996 /ORGANISM="Protocruzia adherens, Strain Boccale" /LENGTH=316 /DNA_ID=CAMNT_0002380927 /DNA_START=197 /DNA_END=1147 /DNA_ORIENTATION=-